MAALRLPPATFWQAFSLRSCSPILSQTRELIHGIPWSIGRLAVESTAAGRFSVPGTAATLARMEVHETRPDVPLKRIHECIRHYWGFDGLRPLQEEAIRAELNHRDSVVVLPTGGGKSLCYQVPLVVAERNDIVVSPLISLMKDQVDGLRACGYPAARH